MPNHSDQPNILFLFPDQWRWDWLGCHDGSTTPYGRIPVRTPHLDRLAQRGVRFTHCRTNSPLCAPARACLAQGVRYQRCRVPSNSFDTPTDSDTVFRRLRDAGYRTACTGKTDLQKRSHFKGLDGWTPAIGMLGFVESHDQCGKWDAVNSGRDRPADPYSAELHRTGWMNVHLADYDRRRTDLRERSLISADPSPLPRRLCTDDFAGRTALDMLQRWPVDHTGQHPAPWMLWVSFPGPHEPFDPPAELQRRYDGVEFPGPVDVPPHAAPQDHPQLRRNYAAMCQGVDDWVGRLIAAVEARGEIDRTLIVFCSDHGENLGDHGRWNKNLPYDSSVRVPLILAGPGVPTAEVRDDLVELIDLSATMLVAAGLDVPAHWDARPITTHGGRPRDVQLSSLGKWRMICDGRWKLVRTEPSPTPWHPDPTALFDLDADPAETTNVAADHPQVVESLTLRLSHETQVVPVK